MAKKKNENTLQYLQMPLPSGRRFSKMTKVAFGGLNKRYELDSGELSMESNISTMNYPYLTPSESREDALVETDKKIGEDMTTYYPIPISMSAFDDFMIVVYCEDNKIMVDYIDSDGEVHTGILSEKEKLTQDDLETPRSIVQFNVYDTPTDPLTGHFIKKLLFFPDLASMFMRIEKEPEGYNVNTADTDVMYYRINNAGKKIFFVVESVRNTDEDGKVTFSREEKTISAKDKDGNFISNCFVCSGMKVDVKAYTNDVDPYLPPDTASHNNYYKNIGAVAAESDKTLKGEGVFRWVEDSINSENSGWI